jgi:hypothetical protein
MKTNTKVALIFPNFRTHSQNEMLFPPLGTDFYENKKSMVLV